MSDGQQVCDAAVVGAYATAASQAERLGDGDRFYLINTVSGPLVVDLEAEADKHLAYPARKSGTYTVHDAASFIAYLSKHGGGEDIWADVQGKRITAVINAHGEGTEGADWEDHRLVLQVQPTAAWRAWVAGDGQMFSQSDFAEFIEDNVVDIVDPPGADMLELAQWIEASVGSRFESSKVLSSGERALVYKETVETRAGRTGQLAIPKTFTLGLMPHEGGAAYKVTARFRYRIREGTLSLGYKLDRPADVARQAFNDIAAEIDSLVEATVLRGVAQ